jgi:hypothetical protein
VDDIAQRFHLRGGTFAPFILTNMNPAILHPNREFDPISADEIGQTIQIPDEDPPDERDWEQYVSSGNENFGDFIARKNKQHRVHNLAGAVLDEFRNASVRAGHGADPGQITLAKGEVVMFPFPRTKARKQGLVVTTGKIRAAAEPSWLRDLRTVCNDIHRDTHALESALDRRRALARRGMREAGVVTPLGAVLGLEITNASPPNAMKTAETQSMRVVNDALTNFGDAAKDAMHARVAELSDPNEDKATRDRCSGILGTLRSSAFVGLIAKLIKEHALHPVAVNEVCDVLEYSYTILSDSPLAADAKTDIARNAAFIAGLRPVAGAALRPVDPDLAAAIDAVPSIAAPNDALGLILGAFSSTLTLATATVGNTVGPSSLFVAIARLHAIHVARQLADDVVKGQKSLEPVAVAVRTFINAVPGTQAQRDALMDVHVAVRNGSLTLPQAQQEYLRQVDAAISGGTMSSKLWLGGIGLIDYIALILATRDILDKGVNVSTAAGLAGALAGATSAGAAGLKMLGMLSLRAETIVSKAVPLVGLGVSLAQVYLSLQADPKTGAIDKTGAVISAVGAIGAAFLVAAAFSGPAAPALAAIGGVLTAGSAIASFVWDLNQIPSDAKAWWLAQMDNIENGPIFKAVSPNDSGLAAAAKKLRSAIESATFLSIDVSHRDEVAISVPRSAHPEALLAQ